MKSFLCLVTIITVAHAHGGHRSQGSGGGYPQQHSYGASDWNGKTYGGGHKTAYSPPIVSHVSRNGDSTSFSIGQQGHVKPIAPAAHHSNAGLYAHAHGGGLYGGSHGKPQYGGLYGYGAESVPDSSFDYTVKHPSNYGWSPQSGASAYAHDAVPGTSYGHAASGSPSWKGAAGKSADWWLKRD